MRLIKLFENFKIFFICKRYYIKNYTINSDGTVDVDGDVHLFDKELTKLPLKFGKVGGNFNCNFNKLTTLEGCPQSVGGYFNCYNNYLKDLYSFPEFFDGEVYYQSNPVSEILYLFKNVKLGKVIDLINEYGVIQQNGKVVILDRLEEVFYTLNMEIPKEINLKNYEVY